MALSPVSIVEAIRKRDDTSLANDLLSCSLSTPLSTRD